MPTDDSRIDAVVLGVDTCGSRPIVGLRIGSDVRTATSKMPDGRADDVAAMVSELLASAGIGAADIGGIGVTTGPGSYTGVRIGLALVRGLAIVDRVPTVGIGSLELLALSARAPGRAASCAVLDAGGGKAYAAIYEGFGAALVERIAPCVLQRDDVADFFANHCGEGSAMVVRCETEAEIAGVRSTPVPHATRAFALVEHAARRLRARAGGPASLVLPSYVGSTGARPNRNKILVGADTAK